MKVGWRMVVFRALRRFFLKIRAGARSGNGPRLTKHNNGLFSSRGRKRSAIYDFRHPRIKFRTARFGFNILKNIRMANGGPIT